MVESIDLKFSCSEQGIHHMNEIQSTYQKNAVIELQSLFQVTCEGIAKLCGIEKGKGQGAQVGTHAITRARQIHIYIYICNYVYVNKYV